MSHGQPVGEVDERLGATTRNRCRGSDAERLLDAAEIVRLGTVRAAAVRT